MQSSFQDYREETRRGADIYMSTRIGTGRGKRANNQDSTELQTTEEHYEPLSFGIGKSHGRTINKENREKTVKLKDQPKEIRYTIYALCILYILVVTVSTAAVVIYLQQGKDTLKYNSAYGSWTLWSVWSKCDVTCDNGTNTRIRLCYNPSFSTEPLDCEGNSTESKQCRGSPCVDNSWSTWGSWGSCTKSCGGGLKSRLRVCSNPLSSKLGKCCEGSSEQVVLCNKNACNVNGTWTLWSSWFNCDVTRDNGTHTRFRLCNNPSDSTEVFDCEGNSTETVQCQQTSCLHHNVSF